MIKTLPFETRKFEPSTKSWVLTIKSLYELIKLHKNLNTVFFDFETPSSRDIFVNQIKKIEAAEFEKQRIKNELEAKKKEWLAFKEHLETHYEEYSEEIKEIHSKLKPGVKLFKHQIQALLYAKKIGSLLLSHSMGTGKSLTSIALVEYMNYKKVFVITPNSLKFNYKQEVEKFTNSSYHIIGWNKNTTPLEEAKYIIVNYDYFSSSSNFDNKWKKLGIDKIDILISDECQALKNSKSNTYKNFKKIFIKELFNEEKELKIFLSGTPMPNSSKELYNVLNQISPIEFHSKSIFYSDYCGMFYNPNSGTYETDISKQNLENLFHKIQFCSHRVKKEDVLDLPPKIYQRIILEMNDKERKIYENIEKGCANEFLTKDISNPLTILLKMRMYTSSLKAVYIKEMINSILDNEDDKFIIIDEFKESLNTIYNYLGDEISCLHTGDVKDVEERANMVKLFQDPNSKLKCFIASLQTANYGLNLTSGNILFLLSQTWSVGKADQVSDRCHRAGQEKKVTIFLPYFENTIDEYVYDVVENKKTEIYKVMDNEDYETKMESNAINEVVNIIKNKWKNKL